ncbi:phosphotransferase enzyme family protein [Streptomyces scopuliridis]|uniref:Aminoglycoside phosphotransferase domain-containing protein n=1 Tax=Streptomyces scopuliridis RB72 TaxID=1440053 RepID=A0A2T7T9H6_9ACTN|nr:phosphotransferase [Streptomyces scopuliridis]PVE11768.1 hypothetical protein Y717_15720 [Streptomyces scopuliridis RB72]
MNRATHGADRLAAVLEREFGLSGAADVTHVYSEADATYIVSGPSGPTHVLKVAAPGRIADVTLQVSLLAHVERSDPGIPVPRVVPTRRGEPFCRTVVGGESRLVHLSTFLAGRPLELAALNSRLVTDIATTQHRLQAVLESFPDAGAVVPVRHPWALDAVLDYPPLVEEHLDAGQRAYAESVTARYAALAAGPAARLPRQVIHGDFNLSNLLTAGRRVSGVIDFGDCVIGPRVHDVAIALAYLAMRDIGARARFSAEYCDRLAALGGLDEDERAMLPLLIAARVVMVLALGRDTARRSPDRAEYALRYDAPAADLLRALRDEEADK